MLNPAWDGDPATADGFFAPYPSVERQWLESLKTVDADQFNGLAFYLPASLPGGYAERKTHSLHCEHDSGTFPPVEHPCAAWAGRNTPCSLLDRKSMSINTSGRPAKRIGCYSQQPLAPARQRGRLVVRRRIGTGGNACEYQGFRAGTSALRLSAQQPVPLHPAGRPAVRIVMGSPSDVRVFLCSLQGHDFRFVRRQHANDGSDEAAHRPVSRGEDSSGSADRRVRSAGFKESRRLRDAVVSGPRTIRQFPGRALDHRRSAQSLPGLSPIAGPSRAYRRIVAHPSGMARYGTDVRPRPRIALCAGMAGNLVSPAAVDATRTAGCRTARSDKSPPLYRRPEKPLSHWYASVFRPQASGSTL